MHDREATNAEPRLRYEIHELLGIGGRGQVYRARDTRLDRWVALKLLRGDDDIRERMLREARAQARVDHPNVCRVFEAGDLDGKPFIAMQLVDGIPIDQAAPELDLRARVEIMRCVAEAVQAAHSRGLVHRDLKPGNVLVERRDGDSPEPFVVDFGLAIEPEAPGLTASGTVLGTPGYMAPEQIRGDRSRVDRRTDVYALGAILYRLLSGRAPYEGNTPVELLLEATKRDPPPLRSLTPEVPRDLALVVHKCLERDPENRYESARLLAEDLERFLDGRPVLAQPPSWTYRTARVLHRHRRLAAAAALTALLGCLGAVKYTLDLRRERAAAEASRQEAEEVADFLVRLLEGARPDVARGREVPVRELADRAAARIEGDLEGRPLVQARIMTVLGSLYSRLGDFDRAETLLDDAVALRERHAPADPISRAAAVTALGDLHYWAGDYAEAQRRYEEARALLANAAARPDAVAPVLRGLAMVAIEEGNGEEALDLLRDAVALRRAENPLNRLALSSAVGELGRAEQVAGDLDAARRNLEESLRLLEPYGSDHPARAAALENLGKVYHDQGELGRAIEALEESVAIDRAVLGEDHHLVGLSLGNLARTYRMAGRYPEAEERYRRTLEIYEGSLGAEHQWAGTTLGNLGKLHRDVGRFDLAKEELERAEAILEKAIGPDAPTTAITVFNRAWLALDLGEIEESEALFQTALGRLRHLGERHPYVGIALEGLGTLYLESGAPARAASTLRQALSIQEEAFGPENARAARCRARLALALADAGNPEEARRLADQSIEILETEVRERPEELQGVRGLAWALLARARAAGSEDTRRAQLVRLTELLGPREDLRRVVELQRLYAEALAEAPSAESLEAAS